MSDSLIPGIERVARESADFQLRETLINELKK